MNVMLFQGAINLLMQAYRRDFASMGGYLTDAGEVNFPFSCPSIKSLLEVHCKIIDKKLSMKYQVID